MSKKKVTEYFTEEMGREIFPFQAALSSKFTAIDSRTPIKTISTKQVVKNYKGRR